MKRIISLAEVINTGCVEAQQTRAQRLCTVNAVNTQITSQFTHIHVYTRSRQRTHAEDKL